MQRTTSILREIVMVTRYRDSRWVGYWWRTAVTVFCLVGLTADVRATAVGGDVELKVGIVQRFGATPEDELTLKATEGKGLTLRFLAGNMEPQTVLANSIKLEIQMQPLAVPEVQEQVVLSTNPNFETAEDSAEQWRAKGIEVEIAQPRRWQVWAKRDIYSTPLLRRLLLQSLEAQGFKTAYLDTEIKKQEPKPSWVVNGLRYNRKNLEIVSERNRIQVYQGKNDRTGRIFVGVLRLQPNAYGTYTLVNQVPLETYLRGVVPNEIGARAPYAALEAQTILARTYALRNLRRFAIDGYELSADIHCQVYYGLSGAFPQTDKAIAATKGLVIVYNNELIDAVYSSTTGGVTASFKDIWNGAERPYLRPVVDAVSNIWDLGRDSLADDQNLRKFINLQKGFNEEGKSLFRWRKETSLPDLALQLQKYLQDKKHPLAKFKMVQQMQVVERSPSGRILKMVVQTDRGAIELHKEEVRSAFLAPISTLFYLDPVKKDNQTLWGYAFVGGGYGHGVGLSQTGAYQLGNLGWSSQQILNFYYPGTQIQPLNDSISFWQAQ
ncbi:SpoIID/LytB domain-containing protein [Argonema galeatum]|uniref:SpoIID/LytB domain-containing protein n=1 Tax=Argonema galeatum TaxID=2942762 RepID=UPI0020133C0D|nr:SpoIID/LytB domain-containing protein [Argonema galeatum]MCL1464844.1 SpoIID/LytB domain-containing protein [Argonema galeatum A003/A1]